MIFFSSYDLLLIPGILIVLWAQWKVKHAYHKYAKVGVQSGVTGADIARQMMRVENIDNVGLEQVAGVMTDHYDPRAKVVRLSEDVYHGRSIAALGIAAHEVGHVIQDARGYAPMRIRHFVYPVSSIGSTLGFPLIFIGFIMGGIGAQADPIGAMILNAGIWLFAAAVAFTLVTLPVEFNASSRAMKALASGGVMTQDELAGARAVLNAAAMTYVAAAAAAVLNLIRILLIARRG
jgi:Zn-dependent membrane protease YugP